MKLLPDNVEVTKNGFIVRKEHCTAFLPFGYNRIMRAEAKAFGERVHRAFSQSSNFLTNAMGGK